MRILAVVVAAMLLGSSCGGGKETTFTNGNYQTLVDHPAKYDGAHVDVVAQIQTATHDEEGTPFDLGGYETAPVVLPRRCRRPRAR
jgi:hypothetical protein